MALLPELEVFQKTIYGEAKGEPEEGQKWVAWVIKNRAYFNKADWGGDTVKGVCLKEGNPSWKIKPYCGVGATSKFPVYGQFECWNGKSDIIIKDRLAYWAIGTWIRDILDPLTVVGPGSWGPFTPEDPTDGCDHYHRDNPFKDGYPEWTARCDLIRRIGSLQFYRTKPEFR